MTKYHNLINDLKKYMFDNSFIELIKSNKKIKYNAGINNKKNINSIKPINKPNSKPKTQYHNLFWWLYILIYSEEEYKNLDMKKIFIIERDIKYKLIELIKEKKHLLKDKKINKISEIESNLACERQINIKTFVSLCILHNISTVIIDDCYMYENIVDGVSPIVLTRIHNTVNYTIERNVSKENLIKCKKSHLVCNGFEFKIKSVSGYTLNQLIEMAHSLKINLTDGKLIKKIIYDKIIEHLIERTNKNEK